MVFCDVAPNCGGFLQFTPTSLYRLTLSPPSLFSVSSSCRPFPLVPTGSAYVVLTKHPILPILSSPSLVDYYLVFNCLTVQHCVVYVLLSMIVI